jgi:hypothetical protein
LVARASDRAQFHPVGACWFVRMHQRMNIENDL